MNESSDEPEHKALRFDKDDFMQKHWTLEPINWTFDFLWL